MPFNNPSFHTTSLVESSYMPEGHVKVVPPTEVT